MLLQLSIRNIAVIESAEITFGDGLNILSGETGAGKSIIIDSVNLILGERADRTLIRTGADSAYVEALFDISCCPNVRKTLYEMYEDNDSELIISRELSSVGRNMCRINGRMATLSQLSQITGELIDIHGQHEHQSLLDPNNHLAVLDAFCKSEITEVMGEYKKLLREYNSTCARIESLKTDDLEKQRRLELLGFQHKEIENMNLEPGEEEELRSKRDELLHYEKIKEAVETSHEMFSGSADNEGGISGRVDSAAKHIAQISDISEKYTELSERLASLSIECDDILDELQKLKISENYEEGDLDAIEGRISDINKLKRKYGSTIEEILEYRDSIKKQMDDLEENELIIDELLRAKKKQYIHLEELAVKITDIRTQRVKA